MPGFSSIKCKFVNKHELWDIADKLITEKWNYGEIPVNIEFIIENEIGLDIIPMQGLYDLCGIDAYLKSDFTAIVVDNTKYNDERYDNRLRFSFAHELGHYILHNYLYTDYDFTIDTPKEYYEFITNFPEKEYRSFEYQANQFAGRLLVPKTKLIEKVSEIYESLKDSGALSLLEDYRDFILERSTPALCKPFGVSENVIKRRVEEENLWPPGEEMV